MTYHCSQKLNDDSPICGDLPLEGDVVVPYDEIHAENGRHFNCSECHETLATNAGGSSKRQRPDEE